MFAREGEFRAAKKRDHGLKDSTQETQREVAEEAGDTVADQRLESE